MTSYDFTDAFDEAEKEGFGPSSDLGAGKYTATVVSANAGETQDGDPKLGFLFKAVDGSVNASGEDVSGDTIWANLNFTERGAKYAARDARALGLTSKMLNSDPDSAVQTAVGQDWKIDVVPSKDGKYLNVRLKKRLDGGDEEAAKPRPKKAKSKAPAEAPVEPTDDAADDAADDADDPWDF